MGGLWVVNQRGEGSLALWASPNLFLSPGPSYQKFSLILYSPLSSWLFLVAFGICLLSPKLDPSRISEVRNERLALNLLKFKGSNFLEVFFSPACFGGGREMEEMPPGSKEVRTGGEKNRGHNQINMLRHCICIYIDIFIYICASIYTSTCTSL